MNEQKDCRVRVKKDTVYNWEKNNPILLNGEMGIVEFSDGTTKIKAGDGINNYLNLPFINVDITKTMSIADNANSWWCNPRCVYNELRDSVYVTGITREGICKLCAYDLRNNNCEYVTIGKAIEDDHCTPCVLLESDKPPIVAYSLHAKEQFVHLKISNTAPYDIRSLDDNNNEGHTHKTISFKKSNETTSAKCSYTSLFRKPNSDTIVLISRFGSTLRMKQSDDWGYTWGEPVVLVDQMPYGTFSINKDNNILQYVFCTHPTETPDTTMIYKVKIDLTSGNVYGQNDTLLTNLWDNFITISARNLGNGTTATSTRAEQIQRSGAFQVRVFDISQDGTQLACLKMPKYDVSSVLSGDLKLSADEATVVYDENNNPIDIEYNGYAVSNSAKTKLILPNRGGIYGIYRKNGNAWIFEEIIESGKPIGYYQSGYVGGMAVINNNEVILCREEDEVWYLEKWVKTEESGTWLKTEIIDKSVDKISRPQIPWGHNDKNIYVYNKYFRYNKDNYVDYYGDEVVKYN